MELRFEIYFKSFQHGFELEVNKKELVSYESGILLLLGIPIYLLNIEEVKYDWWNGMVIGMQTGVHIFDNAIHKIEASVIWCLYWMAYIVDTVSVDEDYSFSREKLEPLIDSWVEWCNTIKNIRSEWFWDFYDWSWGAAVEYPYQLIFIKEEHGIIPCFLTDAVEESAIYEARKKIAFLSQA